MFEESLNSLNLKYFIEQLTSSILDLYCCEYSTYYLNHTEMKTGKYYQFLENNFSQILFELTSMEECKGLTEAQSVELFCDESFFGLRFINKTLKALVKVLQQSEENTFENKFTKTNKRIEKENKRRNIPLNMPEREENTNNKSEEEEIMMEVDFGIEKTVKIIAIANLNNNINQYQQPNL